MRRFLERLLNLFGLRRPDDDLTREIDAHLALLQETYEARGLAPDAARRAARLALGNIEHVKEQHRDARSFRWIEDLWQDAGHGLRLLRRSPLFAATATLSLAIGIGANTAIFTVANGVLLRPPTGIGDPSALVDVGAARGDGGLNPVDHATYLEIVQRTSSLTSVSAEELFPHVMGFVARGTGNTEAVLGKSVTSNFFDALGTLPARGRLSADGEGASDDPRLRLLDAAIQQRRRNRRAGGTDQRAARDRHRCCRARFPRHRTATVRHVALPWAQRHVGKSHGPRPPAAGRVVRDGSSRTANGGRVARPRPRHLD